ncbi:MAG TPA: hypothetical protein VGN07_22505 [Steroidobacteraceae bacterium]|jgi:hypothetical protein
MDVRTTVAALSIVWSGVSTGGTPAAETYSAILKDDGRTWCVFKDPIRFKSEAESERPTESVTITYEGATLTEMSYQVSPESGDWIVLDRYSPTKADVRVKRVIILAQANLQIIQEARIRSERTGRFHIVSVTTLDGKKAELGAVDLPSVPVKMNLLSLPPVKLAAELRLHADARPCR